MNTLFERLPMYRRFIVTGILVFFSLAFLVFFSGSDSLSPVFQGVIISVAFFLVIPLLYSKMVMGEPLQNLGLQKGSFGSGMFTSVIAIFVASALVVGLTIFFPAFHEQYSLPALVQKNFFWFVFYELLVVSSVVLLYEVFFRGLVQLFWLKDFGMWAILVQTGLFYGLSYFGDGFSWQKAPLLIFCPLTGLIAYRSQSLWYSLGASWLFLFFTDVFFLVYR